MQENITVSEKTKPELESSGFERSAKNDEGKMSSILAESGILSKPEYAVEPENNKTPPHIRIARSLLDDDFWQDFPAKCKVLFLTIIKLACFKPRKFDDHGHIIELEVGQLCISERDLQTKCGKDFSKNDIHRYLLKLKKAQKVNLKVNQRKTIITITDTDTYALIKNSSEPRNEPNLNQTRTKLEPQSKKSRKKESVVEVSEAKSNLNGTHYPPMAGGGVSFSRSLGKFQNITPEYLALLRETFPGVDIEQQMREMKLWLLNPKNPRRDGTHAFISSWLRKSPVHIKTTQEPEQEYVPPESLLNKIKRQEEQCATK